MTSQIDTNCEVLPRYSLAFQQNQYPLVSRLRVSIEADSEQLKNIEIKLISDPIFFEPLTWLVDTLEPGGVLDLPSKTIPVDYERLDSLSEEILVNLQLQVNCEGLTLVEKNFETIFMPKNFWAGGLGMPELLAAFCTPNANYVDQLILVVSKTLRKNEYSSDVDGYQSQDRQKPYLMASALWSVLNFKDIAYVVPTPSFATSGQRIRLPDEFADAASGACLDISMLFAACLERMGLNPVVLLTKTHAFAGVWLIDDCLPYVSVDDPMDIRKRIASQDLIIFETTLIASESAVSFAQAIEQANALLSEDKEEEFVLGVDVKQSRKRQIKPLPTIKDVVGKPSFDDRQEPDVPVPPALPPVRPEERVTTNEGPETRVDQWKRKLLDLTKRNRLLNLASNAVAVKLFCPNIGKLEDKLASAEVFSFLPAEDTPLADQKRDGELFKFETGNNLQIKFAIEQLENNSLIVNDTKKRLESRLLSLFRKAKSDIEEGGSNTLYLAIGMLRWKEKEGIDKSYRAPLILLPVELTRASARSQIKIKQLKDEDPIFNSTLIQFLQTDFEIDLTQFRNELPRDESGIDVDGVWDVVRERVKDAPGFEVVEELVLSTFSFAKYLMWKDLQDRVEQLKDNNFVEHLVDRPTEIFEQDVKFISPEEVDRKISPSKIFAPLNADSSQLVAIEASRHPQDFIMVGPPGTGKSETIANIICHNLAFGKKVLFVAEKMAALNVVYKRLVKVGLNHLCLELHSNKANKSAVLEQLRNSWQGREKATQSDWMQKAESLEKTRDLLNIYVSELHKETAYGFSTRRAIARSARYSQLHSVQIDWGTNLENAPVKSAADISELKNRAKKLAIAYSDLEGVDTGCLSLISVGNWSNSWQSNLIKSCQKILPTLKRFEVDAQDLLNLLGLSPFEVIDLRSAFLFTKFSDALDVVIKRNYSLAFSGNVRVMLQELEEVSAAKQSLDNELLEISLGIPLKALVGLPTESWAERYIEVRSKIWPLSFFGLIALRKEIRLRTGVKIKELSVLRRLDNAKKKGEEIEDKARAFEPDKIWRGW